MKRAVSSTHINTRTGKETQTVTLSVINGLSTMTRDCNVGRSCTAVTHVRQQALVLSTHYMYISASAKHLTTPIIIIIIIIITYEFYYPWTDDIWPVSRSCWMQALNVLSAWASFRQFWILRANLRYYVLPLINSFKYHTPLFLTVDHKTAIIHNFYRKFKFNFFHRNGRCYAHPLIGKSRKLKCNIEIPIGC